jgi:hypothetical protein
VTVSNKNLYSFFPPTHDAHLNLLDLLTPALREDTNRAEQVEAGPIPVQLPTFAPPAHQESHPKFFIHYIIPIIIHFAF